MSINQETHKICWNVVKSAKEGVEPVENPLYWLNFVWTNRDKLCFSQKTDEPAEKQFELVKK